VSNHTTAECINIYGLVSKDKLRQLEKENKQLKVENTVLKKLKEMGEAKRKKPLK
jgi:hypothetical protein